MMTYMGIKAVAEAHLAEIWPDPKISLADYMNWITEAIQKIQSETAICLRTYTFNESALDADGSIELPLEVSQINNAKKTNFGDIVPVEYNYLQSVKAAYTQSQLPSEQVTPILVAARYRRVYVYPTSGSGTITIEYLASLPVFVLDNAVNTIAGTDFFEWDKNNIQTKMAETFPPAEFDRALSKIAYYVAAMAMGRNPFLERTYPGKRTKFMQEFSGSPETPSAYRAVTKTKPAQSHKTAPPYWTPV